MGAGARIGEVERKHASGGAKVPETATKRAPLNGSVIRPEDVAVVGLSRSAVLRAQGHGLEVHFAEGRQPSISRACEQGAPRAVGLAGDRDTPLPMAGNVVQLDAARGRTLPVGCDIEIAVAGTSICFCKQCIYNLRL